MSIFFTADPHLGHRNIAKYRPFVSSTEENTELFLSDWRNLVGKRDIVYVLGDVAFDLESLYSLKGMLGRKILIKGNHDNALPTQEHSAVFAEIHGMIRYKKMWLTHCPIHPQEMRKCVINVHGHVHWKSVTKRSWLGREVPDKRYLNVCMDNLWATYGKCLVSLEEVREYLTTNNIET